MGRIVSVINLKGGIGKTTTVVNVGAGLALKGFRVLLIDVDAQGNLAIALGATPKRTIYDVLVDNVDPTKCVINVRPKLDLLAADDTLLSAQTAISRRSDWSRVLDQALQPIKQHYDVIVIDVPGSLTVLSINAITAANDMLVPTTVEPLSLKGLNLLFKQVTRIKSSTLAIRAIIPTMFDSRLRQSVALLEQLQQNYGNIVTPPIRINSRLSEAIALGRTIYEYDPRSRGSLDYAHLVERISAQWNVQPTHQRQTPSAQSSHVPRISPDAAPTPPTINAAPATNHTPVVSAPPPTNHTESSMPTHHQPVVTGTHGVSRPCPLCGHTLRRTIVAGYRVAYCDHCKYIEQELATGVRR